MFSLSDWPYFGIVLAFLAAAGWIAFFGTRMTRHADGLAEATGLGEALMGAVFLGGSTSLPGVVTSVTAAAAGHAEMAISNAMGGIAAQTVFLAIADITYRRANLEHAAASIANMMQGALLVVLLAIVILAVTGPQLTFLGVHPGSVLLVVAYLFGLQLISRARTEPMWRPFLTGETRADPPAARPSRYPVLFSLWGRFVALAAVVALGGYVVARCGLELSQRSGLSEMAIGGIFTAIATSLPELVTSIAAVRQGALTLAVGGIIGGNCFDVLFAAFADVAYRSGSIYAGLPDGQLFSIAFTILLTGILLLGLLRREKHGIGNIGFESFLMIVSYLAAIGILFARYK